MEASTGVCGDPSRRRARARLLRMTVARPSLRGALATKQSSLPRPCSGPLDCFAHRAARRAARWLAMTQTFRYSRELVRCSSVQAFATHLIAPGFKPPAIAKAHFLVSRTTSIGLVRLAQQASSTRGFRTFAFVVHGFLNSGSAVTPPCSSSRVHGERL
jgi:hypothetical protein